jgi:hypothetical protein
VVVERGRARAIPPFLALCRNRRFFTRRHLSVGTDAVV